MDAAGERVKEARIANTPEAFASYFRGLTDKSEVVMEACWNWGSLYDLLGETECVAQVVLANPCEARITADAQIEADKIDAHALGTLLYGRLVPYAYASSPATRSKKNVLRQRTFWV